MGAHALAEQPYVAVQTGKLTDAQRLNAILTLEGMPAELPLLVDSENYAEAPQQEAEHFSPMQEVQSALSLDDATPVDTFMQAQEPPEYRWKDDYKAMEGVSYVS